MQNPKKRGQLTNHRTTPNHTRDAACFSEVYLTIPESLTQMQQLLRLWN